MTPTELSRLLEPGCPWVDLRQWGGLPNVKWCEETLCAWIAEPANTWSNLSYLVAAAALFAWARREGSRALQFFAPAAAIAGLASLTYHASVAFVTQVFDFFGMYVYFLLLLGLNLARLGAVPRSGRIFWPAVLVLTGLTVAVARAGLPVQGIIALLIAAILATEALASRARPARHGAFFLSLALIAAAAAFSAADASRLWCDPSNHWIQGHAIWHALGAAALFASFFHYRQFDESRLPLMAGASAQSN
jgi:hypothetical protein